MQPESRPNWAVFSVSGSHKTAIKVSVTLNSPLEDQQKNSLLQAQSGSGRIDFLMVIWLTLRFFAANGPNVAIRFQKPSRQFTTWVHASSRSAGEWEQIFQQDWVSDNTIMALIPHNFCHILLARSNPQSTTHTQGQAWTPWSRGHGGHMKVSTTDLTRKVFNC